MSAVVLRVDGLTVAYGGNTALSLDALEVHAGEVLGVVGANGAGTPRWSMPSRAGHAASPE